MLPIEWVASNFLTRQLATCFLTFYCDLYFLLNFHLLLICLPFIVQLTSFLLLLLSLLLLLAAMTYNQVQSFQINDYVNHYVDIEITEYRVPYSESLQAGA